MEAASVQPATAVAARGEAAGVQVSTVVFLLYFLLTLAGLAGVGGRLFAYVFVAASTATALVAYYRAPGRYVAFVYALWFFAPWVRRMVDLRHGYQPASFVLMAPVMVTLVALLTSLYRARELRGTMMYPFVLTILGVVYAFFIGVLKNGVLPATYSLLTWLGPLGFAMHLMLNWRMFPLLRKSFLDFLWWAVPVLGAYGIYQVVALPPWDKYWMITADVASIGQPVPFGFRAFGTMNTPGPFAVAIMAGIVFMLGTARRGMVLTLPLALVSLLLTRTRSGWVALAIGVLIVQFTGPLKRIARNWLFVAVMLAVATPILSLDTFRSSIMRRFASFASLEDDSSIKTRAMLSRLAIQQIGARAEGEGLGATGGGTKLLQVERQASIDNGFLELFYVMGWPGGCLVMLGLIGQLLTLARFRDSRADTFANASRAVFWAFLAMLLIGDIFTGSSGTIFWGAYGFACCAHAYNYATGRALRSQQLVREYGAPAPAAVGS